MSLSTGDYKYFQMEIILFSLALIFILYRLQSSHAYA